MGKENDSEISEFLLHGLSEDPELKSIIFVIFLSMYLITVLGNLLIILAIVSDSHLHVPMYFFLSNLSFVDICFTSTTIPKMLVNIQTENKAITYAGCITQMNFYLLFGCLEVSLLSVMAYDRFVAICHPLHYMVIMNPRLCGQLVLVGSWFPSALNSLIQSVMTLQLSFCTDVEIPNFYCELKQMIQLACSDTFLNNVVMYFASVLLGSCLGGILYSYSKIFSSIHRISSAQGKFKAFSTCASHLSVVSLFFCTSLTMYFSSATTHNSQSGSISSVMYAVVTPMLNPFIYSLRNKDIKMALQAFFMKGTIQRQLS
ncbi:olfactory receptor 7A17-like [Sorex araneus]|uniref:olfactory receptor 7A17-like n=1 Tax=Sorex araneus TaxID=42254 RepID=UPI00064A8E6F|nr:olfactory receptor 7A17-like [Sorex araneus]